MGVSEKDESFSLPLECAFRKLSFKRGSKRFSCKNDIKLIFNFKIIYGIYVIFMLYLYVIFKLYSWL